MNQKNKIAGFSLVEMLVVVVMISILTGIAYSSYHNYVRKGRRAEAMQTLTSIQMAQEKHRLSSTTYGSLTDVWGGVTQTTNALYTLQISNTSATGYTITATAQGDQTSDREDGSSCNVLTLSLNQTTVTKTPTKCW